MPVCQIFYRARQIVVIQDAFGLWEKKKVLAGEEGDTPLPMDAGTGVMKKFESFVDLLTPPRRASIKEFAAFVESIIGDDPALLPSPNGRTPFTPFQGGFARVGGDGLSVVACARANPATSEHDVGLREGEAPADASAAGAVQLMTVHKGLEFPLTVIADAACEHRGNSSKIPLTDTLLLDLRTADFHATSWQLASPSRRQPPALRRRHLRQRKTYRQRSRQTQKGRHAFPCGLVFQILLLELDSAERHHEVPYFLPEGRGVIDLLYRANNDWHIMDFKTDELRSGIETESAISQNGYDRQLARYARAIEEQLGVQAKMRLVFLNVKGDIAVFDS